MQTQTQPQARGTRGAHSRRQWLGGTALIVIGLLLLAGQLTHVKSLGALVPALLGLIFLLWGIIARSGGLLIPGGILTGIGAGAALDVFWPGAELTGEAEGALFLLTFALGWGLITACSALFTQRTLWWPLIPGGILALVGGALLLGEPGRRALEFAGQFWPVVLILIGLGVLLRRRPTGSWAGTEALEKRRQ